MDNIVSFVYVINFLAFHILKIKNQVQHKEFFFPQIYPEEFIYIYPYHNRNVNRRVIFWMRIKSLLLY